MNNRFNAIIFNPNQELELIKKQKEIIKSFARENQKAFPKFPAFCFLKSPEWNGLSLKETKSIIKKVSFEEIYLKDFSVYQKIKILISKSEKTISSIEEAVQIATLKANDSHCSKSIGECSLSNTKEEMCKIFKLAQVECSEYSWTINEYIWCKL